MGGLGLAAVLAGGGLVLLIVGAVVLYVYSRRSATVEGTVTSFERSSSFDIPVVTFTPQGGAGPRTMTVARDEARPDHQLGETLRVFYDPRHPRNAGTTGPRRGVVLAALIGLPGLVCLAVAAVQALFLAPMVSARDAAIDEFMAAARTASIEQLRSVSAPGAVLDEGFLLSAVPMSRDFEIRSDAIDFDDTSCVRGTLTPTGVQVELSLVERVGRWRVRHAANVVPECEEDLSPNL